MKRVTLLSTLKGKNEFDTLAQSYLKRLKLFELRDIVLKAKSDDPKEQDQVLLTKLKSLKKSQTPKIILLSEEGIQMNSLDFSLWFQKELKDNRELFFLIGGAEGFGEKIREQKHQLLSLSSLTFPHKLAKIILIEQLYRAQTLWSGHPYHNETPLERP